MTIQGTPATGRYAEAGVDIDAGADLVQRIAPMARATGRPGTMGGLGGFGGLFDLAACGFRDPVLVATTDGVGTKVLLAAEAGANHAVGIDLVAMCVNDLVVQGAQPLFFLDYFATGKLSVDEATRVINAVAALFDTLQSQSTQLETYLLSKGLTKSNVAAPKSTGF